MPPINVVDVFQRDSTRQSSAFDHVWLQVENGNVVVLSMTLSAAFYIPDVFGVVDATEAPDSAMRHAVVAVGTGQRGTTRFLLVRNSWGESWGISGYGWLSEAYAADKITATLTLD
jgi:C1A family cysteine protease